MHRTTFPRPRPMGRRALIPAALTAFALALAAPSAAQVASGSFARARDGAVARNFADANGNELARLAPGHPVRVFSTSEGVPRFYEVEVAGGVPVWVFGELLQPTNIDGVLRVDASHVNMRPLPESSPRSMALRSKLQAGERIQVIERANPSKPLAEDWVKVWSPESARVWVEVGQVELVPEGDAAALSAAQVAWADAGRKVPTPREAERAAQRAAEREDKQATAALPPIPTVPQEAVRALTEADVKFDAVMALPESTSEAWNEVHALYQQAYELAPKDTATHARAFERMRTVEGRREIAALREQMRAEDERRKAELSEIVAERERQALRETVHWGRFQGRGWLESRNMGGERRWYLVWSGETVAEVRCSSARYDLDVFEGHELGVTATTVSPPVAATALSPAMPRVLDIMRIEVLSGSTRPR